MSNEKIRFTFRKYERISKFKEIQRVINKGEKFFIRGLIVYIYTDTGYKFSRLAVLVSSKIEKLAVLRNKFKRRIREIFRLNKHRIVKPVDIVVIATKESIKAKYGILEECFIEALKTKGLIENAKVY